MQTLRHSRRGICVLILCTLGATQVNSREQTNKAISLDCTIKGGASDGTHLLITISPSKHQAMISGMQGIGGADFTITNDEVLAAEGQIGNDRAEMHQEATHDSIYDYRKPLKRGYVQVSDAIIKFGYTTWLPGTPNNPNVMFGPTSKFTIDRRTGALRFETQE